MNSDDQEIEKGLNLIAKSSIFVFFAIGISKILTYLYRIILARYYGPETYGLFSLGIMIFSFFMAVTSLGLFDGLLRFIPIYRGQNQKNKIQYVIRFSTKILLFLSIISGSLLYFSSEFISKRFFHDLNLVIYLKIFAILIPIQVLTNLYFSVMRSHEKIKSYSFGMNILENLSKFIFILLFIYIGILSSKAVPLSYFFAIFSGLVFAYIYCRIKLPDVFLKSYIPKSEKNKINRKLFSYSWPLILYGIVASLMYYLDTFLIGYFKDSYWVGIYNSAIPLAMLLLLSTEMFMQMFFPMITREISSKKDVVVRELSKQISKWIFMINLPLTILIVIFPGVFINLFFGETYLPAINSLRILAIGQFIYSMGIVSNNLMLSYGKSKILLINLIGVSILNVLLNWFLIPIYGIDGAAIATCISLVILSISSLSLNYFFNRLLPIRRKMVTIFFISLIPTLILYEIRKLVEMNAFWLIILSIMFVSIYLILILITKSFDKNDISLLKKFFKKIN